MLTYGIMVIGFVALSAMLYDGMRLATPARFLTAGCVVATVWFALCLVVLR